MADMGKATKNKEAARKGGFLFDLALSASIRS
jgi:hypothetical protein